MTLDVLEGESFTADVLDIEYIEARLGGLLERRRDGWAITRRVGHLALPSGRTLRIRSAKAPATSILAWLAHVDPSLDGLRFLGTVPEGSLEADVGSLLAHLFVLELWTVLGRNGLLRPYGRLPVNSAAIRGRIDFARMLREGRALSELPCVVWERQSPSPVNCFLSAALQVLRKDPVLRAAGGSRLPALLALFDGVPARVDSRLLRGQLSLDRREAPFRCALDLARLVLRGAGLVEGTTRTGPAFLIDLEMLFEKTVVHALQQAGVETLAKQPLPYERRSADGTTATAGAMQMDAYCPTLATGSLVVDAKYKTAVSASNLQQMVTYCFMTGARRGVLVLPAGNVADRRTYVFRSGGSPSSAIDVRIAELATDARDVAGWRARTRELAAQLLDGDGTNRAGSAGAPSQDFGRSATEMGPPARSHPSERSHERASATGGGPSGLGIWSRSR